MSMSQRRRPLHSSTSGSLSSFSNPDSSSKMSSGSFSLASLLAPRNRIKVLVGAAVLFVTGSFLSSGGVGGVGYGMTGWKGAGGGEGKDHLDIVAGKVVETRIQYAARGFTAFENVYLHKGIWWIVSRNASGEVPPLFHMHVGDVPKPNQLDLSTQQIEQHIRLVSPDEAAQVLGRSAGIVKVGVEGKLLRELSRLESFVSPEPQEADVTFGMGKLAHYGHMVQELFFGSWRLSTLAWPTSSSFPTRLFFTLFEAKEWRDGPGLNAFTLRSAFPSISYLYATDFRDLQSSTLTLVFPRLLLVDRQAAKLAPLNSAANKMVAELGERPQGLAGKTWWEPVRQSVVKSAEGGLSPIPELAVDKPVITYVSRQQAEQRSLVELDHQLLVDALESLGKRKKVEVNVVHWEHLTSSEQILLASRTTIFLTLHGNGLSHQLWAPTHPLSTTIEMLYPGGWARDFELPARMMGRQHYAFWGDTLLWGEVMARDEPAMVMPDGFQDRFKTPIKAGAVITLLEAILDGTPVPPHKTQL